MIAGDHIGSDRKLRAGWRTRLATLDSKDVRDNRVAQCSANLAIKMLPKTRRSRAAITLLPPICFYTQLVKSARLGRSRSRLIDRHNESHQIFSTHLAYNSSGRSTIEFARHGQELTLDFHDRTALAADIAIGDTIIEIVDHASALRTGNNSGCRRNSKNHKTPCRWTFDAVINAQRTRRTRQQINWLKENSPLSDVHPTNRYRFPSGLRNAPSPSAASGSPSGPNQWCTLYSMTRSVVFTPCDSDSFEISTSMPSSSIALRFSVDIVSLHELASTITRSFNRKKRPGIKPAQNGAMSDRARGLRTRPLRSSQTVCHAGVLNHCGRRAARIVDSARTRNRHVRIASIGGKTLIQILVVR